MRIFLSILFVLIYSCTAFAEISAEMQQLLSKNCQRAKEQIAEELDPAKKEETFEKRLSRAINLTHKNVVQQFGLTSSHSKALAKIKLGQLSGDAEKEILDFVRACMTSSSSDSEKTAVEPPFRPASPQQCHVPRGAPIVPSQLTAIEACVHDAALFEKAPKVTVQELFSTLISTNDHDGWKVRGKKYEIGDLTKNEDHSQAAKLRNQVLATGAKEILPVSAHPIPLTEKTRILFQGLGDDTLKFDGSQMAFVYVLEPKILNNPEEGIDFTGREPLPIYLIREIPKGMTKKQISSKDKWRDALYQKSKELKQEGHPVLGFSYFEAIPEAGTAEEQTELGEFYEKGIGPEHKNQNFDKTIRFYQEAAKNGSKRAEDLLSRPAFKEFIKTWKEAHNAKPNVSQVHLAQAYRKGNSWLKADVKKSLDLLTQAKPWCEKQVQKESKKSEEGPEKVKQAQYCLGVLHAEGAGGVEKNLDQAKEWLKKAAEANSVVAREYLADLTHPLRPLTSLGIHWVPLPGGKFQMGSPATEAGHFDNEKQHEVELSGFTLTDHITRAQWKDIMGTDPEFSSWASQAEKDSWAQCGDCPVTYVSWDDVQKFIKKLEERTGIKTRLPTEAEAEYKMRVRGKEREITTTAYPWGNDVGPLANHAWYSANSEGRVHSVGSTPEVASEGVRDARGNVYTWTGDWYGEYTTGALQVNPTGPENGSSRVIRGGSWAGLPRRHLRSAYRLYKEPGFRDDFVGFCLVIR